jgi:hypothetical protein
VYFSRETRFLVSFTPVVFLFRVDVLCRHAAFEAFCLLENVNAQATGSTITPGGFLRRLLEAQIIPNGK